MGIGTREGVIEVSESGTCDGIGLPAVGVGTGLLGLATTGANESTVTGFDCGEGSVVHQQLVQMTAPLLVQQTVSTKDH